MKIKLIILGLGLTVAYFSFPQRLEAQTTAPPDTVEVTPIDTVPSLCLAHPTSAVINDTTAYLAYMKRYRHYVFEPCETSVFPEFDFSDKTMILFFPYPGGCSPPRNVNLKIVYIASKNKYTVSATYTQVGNCAVGFPMSYKVFIPKIEANASVEFKQERIGYVEE